MRNSKYNYIKLSLLFLILFFFSCDEEEPNKQNITEKLSQRLMKLWNSPSKAQIKKFSCGQLVSEVHLGSTFFSCNPYFLECAINKMQKEIEQKGLRLIGRGNNYLLPKLLSHQSLKHKKLAYELKIHNQEDEFSLFFLHHCREKLLPQGSYLSLNYQNDEKVWDNYQQKIWLDQFYVSNLDIYSWKRELYKPNESLSSPATHLSKEQMKQYCKNQGKELAQSHIIDAFSIPPSNFNKAFSRKLFYYPYVQDKDKNLPFFKDKNLKLEQSDCLKVYTKECLNIIPLDQLNFFDSTSSSWSGVYFLQGFFPEISENIFFPGEDLSLSSFYISRLSKNNENSQRVPKQRIKEILDKESIITKEIKKAFRCMRRE